MKDLPQEEGLSESGDQSSKKLGSTFRGRKWKVEDRKRLTRGYIIHEEIVQR